MRTDTWRYALCSSRGAMVGNQPACCVDALGISLFLATGMTLNFLMPAAYFRLVVVECAASG